MRLDHDELIEVGDGWVTGVAVVEDVANGQGDLQRTGFGVVVAEMQIKTNKLR